MSETKQQKRVFIAMSGGVDSSVAAALLKQAGYDVVGVTMCFSIKDVRTKKPSCCGMEGVEDAKTAARILGIPHYVLDFAGDIQDLIIEDFMSEYLTGRTPNPCVRCNQHIKFGTLYQKVMALGGDFLATGHYAKVEYDECSQDYLLREAKDKTKDQTYFLCGIKKDRLQRLLFPLGDLTKEDVRKLAEQFSLNTAQKPESQDLCFVPDGGYKQFIHDRVGSEAFRPGEFRNHHGEVVGEHRGIANYTIGQRDKLGLALGKPVYVYRIDAQENIIYVGPKECLFASGLEASQFNLIGKEILKEKIEVKARIRYNAPEIQGTLIFEPGGKIQFLFQERQLSVTPGQSVVFYQEDIVLAGAVIDRAI